jgi:hypothetical protein
MISTSLGEPLGIQDDETQLKIPIPTDSKKAIRTMTPFPPRLEMGEIIRTQTKQTSLGYRNVSG